MLIPERISELMDRRGWKPGELAYQSGASYAVIYKLLNTPRHQTSAIVLAKIASALGCSIEYLLGMTDSPAPMDSRGDRVYATVADAELRRVIQDIVDDITQMSDTDRQFAVEMIRRLAPKRPRIIGDE